MAFRLPRGVAEDLAIGEGSSVELTLELGGLLIRPTQRRRARRDIKEIVAEMDPATFPDETFETIPVGEELL